MGTAAAFRNTMEDAGLLLGVAYCSCSTHSLRYLS